MKTKVSYTVSHVDVPDFFDVAPTSLWLEDYSKLRILFESWRSRGVQNLRAYLQADHMRIQECSASIQVLRVNQRTLTLYAAQAFDELAGRLDDVLRDDTQDAFIGELEQLWKGQGTFKSKTVNYALDGRRLDILLKGVVLPGHEFTWDRVL